jgi:DNA-binding SARP family transcriptional activator
VVDDAGVHVPVPASRLRVLFAALLLHANTPVPVASLADLPAGLVWDRAPPHGASVTLRSYVDHAGRAPVHGHP